MSWIFRPKKQVEPAAVSGASNTRQDSDPHQRAIYTLKQAFVTEEKREKHVDRKVVATVKDAKEKMARGDKRGALFALKRKKMYEAEIDKIQNVKMTLETQIIQLESSVQTKASLGAMAEGSKMMAGIHAVTGIERVDEVMDHLKEHSELQTELNTAMAQSVTASLCDDDELLDELNALSTSDTAGERVEAPNDNLQLPIAPERELPEPTKSSEEDRDTKDLEAEHVGLMQ